MHPTFRSDADHRGDVLVRVDGVEFWVHKDVLLFSSPFFKSVLEGGWKESRLSTLLHAEEAAHPATADETELEEGEHRQRIELKSAGASADEGATDPTGASAKATGGSEGTPQPTLAMSLAEEQEAAVDDVAELDKEHLDTGSEARRRSLLRASYHTALWSQDDERAPSPTLSQCAAGFTDPSENALSTDEAEGPSAAGDDTESEDDFQQESDAEQDAKARNAGEPDQSGAVIAEGGSTAAEPAATEATQRQRSGSLGLKQVRSKSKHLAARLTLRKLESAQRDKSIPTRSTSKGKTSLESSAEPSTWAASAGPLERFESLATPPVSRRASQEAPFTSLGTSDAKSKPGSSQNETSEEPPPPPRKTTLPSRYRGIISVIDLEEESASTFHDFLFHAYPHLDLSVTWFNCGLLLRFSDKFQVPFLRRSCVSFLRAALAGRPIEAMRLAELHGMDDLYKEASRHVLDNFSAWEPDELEVLSRETLLKLERKRTWFLERLLKLGLANPARDYECHPSCPDPAACARALHEKWQAAYANAFRFSPPQPSAIFRHLRELDPPSGASMQLSSCQATSRVWVQGLFDRMFELGTLHTGRLFLAVKLDGQVQRNVSSKEF